MPDGEATVIQTRSPLVRIVEGKVLSYVEVHTNWGIHKVSLMSSPGKNHLTDICRDLNKVITFGIKINDYYVNIIGPDGTGFQIYNEVDIRQMNNVELGMRFSTDVNSGDEFFTDLNGFQMMKRKRRLDKLPIGANYFPIPSMAYIQDEKSRLTLVTKQPLGGSSLKSGQLEIMMDRRLSQDDNRGLFQGVSDNHITPHTFYLVLERKYEGCASGKHNVLSLQCPFDFNQPHKSTKLFILLKL